MRRGIAMRHPWYQDVTGGQKPRSEAKLRCNRAWERPYRHRKRICAVSRHVSPEFISSEQPAQLRRALVAHQHAGPGQVGALRGRCP